MKVCADAVVAAVQSKNNITVVVVHKRGIWSFRTDEVDIRNSWHYRETETSTRQMHARSGLDAVEFVTKEVICEIRVNTRTINSYGVPYNCRYTLALRMMACTYSRVSVNGIDSTNSAASRYLPCPIHSSTRSEPAL